MTCNTLQGKYAERLEEERNKLNETIETLYKKLDAQDKIIDEQALEISQLKNQKQQVMEYIKETIFNYNTEDTKKLLELLGDKENE